MYIQVLGGSIPITNDRHDLTPRAVLPADPPTASEPSTLFPLLTLTLVFLLVAFVLVRLFKRFNPNLSLGLRLPNYSWLRGKGQGARGRLSLSGVELLPTSMKSIPTPSPSPHLSVFAGSSNVGKESTSTLLSRSSSFDTLPRFPASPIPAITTSLPIRSPRRATNPFKFSIFPGSGKSKMKGKSVSHRRSKSLGVPTRHLTVSPTPFTSVNNGTSVPSTPSPHALLIDFSSSSGYTSATTSDTTSPRELSSSSSDLGTQRYSPDADGPLIPLPIPKDPSSTSPLWSFDLDVEESQQHQPSIALIDAFTGILPHRTSSVPPAYDSTPSTLPAIQQTPFLPAFLSASQPSRPPSRSEFYPVPPGLSGFGRSDGDVLGKPFDHGETFEMSALSDRPAMVSLSAEEKPYSPRKEDLRDLEAYIREDVGFVGAHASAKELQTEKLVDLAEDSGETKDEPAAEPTVEVGATLKDTLHPVTPENMIHSFTPISSAIPPTVEDPISVTIEPATPLPSVDLWDDIGADTLKTPEQGPQEPGYVSEPLITMAATDIIPLPSPLEPMGLVEASSHSSVTTSPVAMDTWTWDDPWNFGPEHDADSDMKQARAVEDDTGINGDLILFEGTGEKCSMDVRGAEVIESRVGEEPWSVEEVTVVCPDEETEENNGMVLEKEVLDAFFSSEELITHSEPEFEPDMLMQQLSGEHAAFEDHAIGFDQDQEDAHKSHENNKTIVTLESLPIPLITISTSKLADPNPLPCSSPHVQSPHQLLQASKQAPSQTPTPPTSPPISPSRALPTSTLSSPNGHLDALPIPIVSAPSSAMASPARPAWSIRASDAPTLGLPVSPGLRQRSSPDLRALSRHLSTIGKQTTDSCVSEDNRVIPSTKNCDISEKSEHTATKDEKLTINMDQPEAFPTANLNLETGNPEKPAVSVLPSPTSLSTSLPGSFPILLPSDNPSVTPSHGSSTALTSLAVPRRRAPRSPLDIALAMQLRPGLGPGADPAWMVRFLMSMFGWFAILLSGQAEFDGYRNGNNHIGH